MGRSSKWRLVLTSVALASFSWAQSGCSPSASNEGDAGPADDAGSDAAVLADAGAAPELRVIERSNDCWYIEDLIVPEAQWVETSLQLDGRGAPYVMTSSSRVHFDDTAESNVRLFVERDGVWEMEDVRTEGFELPGQLRLAQPRTALGPNDVLHLLIGQYDQNIVDADPPSGVRMLQGSRGAGDWPLQPVPSDTLPYDFDLRIDAFGLGVVLARESLLPFGTETLWLLRESPDGSWTPELVLEEGVARRRPVLALDRHGAAHILFEDVCPPSEPQCAVDENNLVMTVRYGTNASGSWTFEGLGFVARESRSSIAVDGDGFVHIAAVRADGVSHTSNQTGAWVTERVLDDRRPYGWTSIAMDDNGAAHIAVGAMNSGKEGELLMYVTNRGGEWLSEEIDGLIRGPSSAPAIGVDGAGIPHVAYTTASIVGGEGFVHASHAHRCEAVALPQRN